MFVCVLLPTEALSDDKAANFGGQEMSAQKAQALSSLPPVAAESETWSGLTAVQMARVKQSPVSLAVARDALQEQVCVVTPACLWVCMGGCVCACTEGCVCWDAHTYTHDCMLATQKDKVCVCVCVCVQLEDSRDRGHTSITTPPHTQTQHPPTRTTKTTTAKHTDKSPNTQPAQGASQLAKRFQAWDAHAAGPRGARSAGGGVSGVGVCDVWSEDDDKDLRSPRRAQVCVRAVAKSHADKQKYGLLGCVCVHQYMTQQKCQEVGLHCCWHFCRAFVYKCVVFMCHVFVPTGSQPQAHIPGQPALQRRRVYSAAWRASW